MKDMCIYKIRLKGTELYSTGNTSPEWKAFDKSKVWNKINHVHSHITTYYSYIDSDYNRFNNFYGREEYLKNILFRYEFYKDAEIVAFKVNYCEIPVVQTKLDEYRKKTLAFRAKQVLN